MHKKVKRLIVLIASISLVATLSLGVVFGAQKQAEKLKFTTPSAKSYKIPKGSKVKFKVAASPKGVSSAVIWKSSNKKIATISKKGVVKAVKTGKVKITAVSKKNRKVKVTKIVNVVKKVKNIKVASPNTSTYFMDQGTKRTFKISASPKGTSKEVIWASSNRKIATVNAKGVVKAIGPGTVSITAKSKFKSSAKATVKLTVGANITGVTINGDGIVGGKLEASVTPTNAKSDYIWYRVSNGKRTVITGEKSKTYTANPMDEGKEIQVGVVPSGSKKAPVYSKGVKVYSKADAFAAKVDPEYALNMIQFMVKQGTNEKLGFRMSGSDAEKTIADKIYNEYKTMGLSNVTMDKIDADGFDFTKGQITYTNGMKTQTADIASYQTTFQTDGAKEYDLVYVGSGTKYEYQGKDVKGKAVLIDTDQYNSSWITVPAYEAYVQGAAVVIACEDAGGNNGFAMYSDDQIQLNDICGPEYAPALSVSRNTRNGLKASINDGGGECKIKLDVDAKVTMGKGSQNVWAEIPGKSDEAIIIMSHYDSYFNSVLDDADGTVINMSIAKAMIESGYIPDKTIRFVHHGAEEWGMAGSGYSWGVGAYRQIFDIHPEWAKDAFAAINVDSFTVENGNDPSNSSNIKKIRVNSPQLDEFSSNIISGKLPDGYALMKPETTANTSFEDFAYMISGIPKILFARSDYQSQRDTYHSSADNYQYYSDIAKQDEIIGQKAQVVAAAIMAFDEQLIQPVNYKSYFTSLKGSIDADISEYDAVVAINAVDSAESIAEKIDNKIAKINEAYVKAVNENDKKTIKSLEEKAGDIHKDMSSLYKAFQKGFTRLDQNGSVLTPHQNYQDNVEALRDGYAMLEDNEVENAMWTLAAGVDTNILGYYFSKPTYNHTVRLLSGPIGADKMLWGYGLIDYPNENLFNVVNSLAEKSSTSDVSAELDAVEDALDNQKNYLSSALRQEAKSCNSLIKKMNNIINSLN